MDRDRWKTFINTNFNKVPICCQQWVHIHSSIMLYKWSSNLPINNYSEAIPLVSESNWLHSVFNCFRYMNNYRLAGMHRCNGVVLGGRFSRSLINISLCINNCTVQNRLISLYETCVCLIIYLVPLWQQVLMDYYIL